MGGFHALAASISFLFAPFDFTPTQISFICKLHMYSRERTNHLWVR